MTGLIIIENLNHTKASTSIEILHWVQEIDIKSKHITKMMQLVTL